MTQQTARLTSKEIVEFFCWQNKPSEICEVVEGTGLPPGTVSKALSSLRKEGIVPVPTKGRGRPIRQDPKPVSPKAREAVFLVLQMFGSLTRAQIATKTGRSPIYIHVILQEMIRDKLVTQEGTYPISYRLTEKEGGDAHQAR